MEKAIEKINAEMQKEPDNQYLEIVGHYVIDRCDTQQNADKVNNDKLTLEGAMKELTEIARKKAKKSCAVMKDNEIFDCVDEYFGFEKDINKRVAAIESVDGKATAVKEEIGSMLDLDFESLI